MSAVLAWVVYGAIALAIVVPFVIIAATWVGLDRDYARQKKRRETT